MSPRKKCCCKKSRILVIVSLNQSSLNLSPIIVQMLCNSKRVSTMFGTFCKLTSILCSKILHLHFRWPNVLFTHICMKLWMKFQLYYTLNNLTFVSFEWWKHPWTIKICSITIKNVHGYFFQTILGACTSKTTYWNFWKCNKMFDSCIVE